MKTNQAGIKLLHEFESCKLKAYKCPAGIWTIGWGNTFYENGTPVKEGDVITQQRADSLFLFVLSRFEDQAKRAITSNVNDNQFSAFVSALYNIGPGSSQKSGLIRLKNGQPSTLLKKINTNPNDPSIHDEFMKWVSKGSAFEKGLTRRRQAESKLYFT
ncbi:MAG: lysozyme [Cyclobacteriaceae bacterium]|nr:lysozyme [Cyclobacteriaceae bacterium]